MIVHIDTSALVDALTGPRRSLEPLIQLVHRGDRLAISSLVLFEWRRGPRTAAELAVQEELFPSSDVMPFGPAEALLAAELYQHLRRARGREIDIAVAACALTHNAALWTLNPADFADIPQLRLVAGRGA